jgi:CO/xanthine dehydrogenase FAD-binding subunit
MYAFTYLRPTTVRQAVNLLNKHEDAKLLAGGHSLIPVMKLRLANPPVLIDLSKVEGISGVELKGRSIVVGAMTKHVDVANAQAAKENLSELRRRYMSLDSVIYPTVLVPNIWLCFLKRFCGRWVTSRFLAQIL